MDNPEVSSICSRMIDYRKMDSTKRLSPEFVVVSLHR
jgi:hypothetical protein